MRRPKLRMPVGSAYCRIMQAYTLLLRRKHVEHPEHVDDGKVIVMRSNLRRCSDGYEFTCWNGRILRGARDHCSRSNGEQGVVRRRSKRNRPSVR